MKTRRFCPKCGRPVLKSPTKGYVFQCFCCDEDFYRFEVLRKKDMAEVRFIRKQAVLHERQQDYVPHSLKSLIHGTDLKQRKRISMAEIIKIIDTQFHIEAGYNGGYMPREQHDAFYAELKKVFTANGFRYEERKIGCPDVVLGKTCLYCHPTCLSGPVEETHFPVLEQILSNGKSFRLYSLDKHNELQDFTTDEELEYYRSCTESVENDLLVAFKTKRSNLFKLKGEILELEAVKIHVPTIRTPYMSGYASIPRQFINEVYKNMVQKRHLIESSKAMGIQTIPLCRTANQKELRLLE